MALLPVELPEENKPVRALIKHFEKWDIHDVELYACDDDDCDWRFVNDDSELAFEYNVIYWEYKTT